MAAQQKPTQFTRPDGEVRQSQLVSTFGPGALVDLVEDAVIISGLDHWHFGKAKQFIHEPRLRDDLVQRFQSSGRKLDGQNPFRAAPVGDSRSAWKGHGVDALEFPRWVVCQNSECRALTKSTNLDRKRGYYQHICDDGKPHPCVPVRFAAACRNGHIDEWPWVHWVHDKPQGEKCLSPRLKLEDGATGDFAEVVVRCTACGMSRRLLEASNEKANPACFGARPWLGSEGKESCGETIRLLTRSASNAYFPQVESALSIPDATVGLRELVKDQWNILQAVKNSAMLEGFLAIPSLEKLKTFPVQDVLDAIDDERNHKDPGREPIRNAEYRQFLLSKDEVPGHIPPAEDDFYACRVPSHGIKGVKSVILVKKLRQVRVQVGFTRLEAQGANLQGEYDLDVRSAALSLTQDWLPATEVRGEGVFIELDEDTVHGWETSDSVTARAAELLDGFERWKKEKKSAIEFPGARFYLLHSVGHLLMTALALECGYPASALSERIYCAPHDSAMPMAGLLILTGSSSTEGTLGGLVEEGRRLKDHLRRALDMAHLCSNDPVCSQHSPKEDLAERHLEGAACHGCLFVAECSCERFNTFLDRALVVPTLGPAGCAYFKGAT